MLMHYQFMEDFVSFKLVRLRYYIFHQSPLLFKEYALNSHFINFLSLDWTIFMWPLKECCLFPYFHRNFDILLSSWRNAHVLRCRLHTCTPMHFYEICDFERKKKNKKSLYCRQYCKQEKYVTLCKKLSGIVNQQAWKWMQKIVKLIKVFQKARKIFYFVRRQLETCF